MLLVCCCLGWLGWGSACLIGKAAKFKWAREKASLQHSLTLGKTSLHHSLTFAVANLHSLQQSRALANELLQHSLTHTNASDSKFALLTTVQGVSK